MEFDPAPVAASLMVGDSVVASLVANATAVYCSLCRSDYWTLVGVCLCQAAELVGLFFEILVGFEPSRHLSGLSAEYPGGFLEELMSRFMSRGIDSPKYLLCSFIIGVMSFGLHLL